MLIHTVFDLLGWLTAALIGVIVGRLNLLAPATTRTPFTDPGYFIALGIGALVGAIFVGSLNLNLAGTFALGHSIAGGIIGGIVGVEIYKWANGLRGSTGRGFVAPLAAGIAVGRLGCFFAGLPDYTYGIPTTLPWGVDFGDGIPRHPVQLYESGAMLVFLVAYLGAIARRSAVFSRDGFYIFVAYYGVQRFVWEFLKPYPTVIGPFNVFHLLCLAMIAYSLVMIGRNREPHPAR
jgi:phosphatidylglycerol---prolipoprotein diacylglyceryl transferase